MITNLELDLPDFYISKPLERDTFNNFDRITTSLQVINKLYMIANNVKPDYYFMETPPSTGYFLSAKIQPTFAFVGDAMYQIKKEPRLISLLKIKPLYRIKASLYKENNYNKIWEFEHITKNKNEIYKTIIDLKQNLEKQIS